MSQEIQFAKGDAFSETSRMRVAYTKNDRLHPQAFYPVIYQTAGDGTVYKISMTPAEGRWLADVLARMFREV